MAKVAQDTTNTHLINSRKAVPVILFLFVFSLIIDNSFKIISIDLANDFGLSSTTVSWQVTLAGLVIGIGAVVYATLSDTISVRTLLIAGILLICAGSILGFIFQHSFALVVVSRIIQSAGLAATETLYIIFVAKNMPKEEQKMFLGFSTSAYSIALVIGTLTGGYVSTYLNWTTLFLIPLLTLLILPFILKYLPKEKSKGFKVDVIGLLLIAAVAATLIIYVTKFSWLYFGLFILSLVLFLLFISKSNKAFIQISFFKNKRMLSVFAVAFIIYTIQLAYIFMFPFLIESIYGLKLDKISLLFIPAYLIATLIGAMSGKIAKVLGSKQCIMLAISLIATSLLLGGLFVETSVWVFVFSMILFSGSFALMYAPMLDMLIGTISKEQSGTALGFYNLCLNIAASIGIAYVAAMMDNKSLQQNMLGFIGEGSASLYSNILFILTFISLVSLMVYWLLVARKVKLG
ncbi:MFS transporter [Sporosarcina sp. ANT_H38]|uniref:MFS transporter n=1 Tax=Sporosarcina sp. ANT_H38 TaxID=2597358 RepID=UPI0011F31280|nr:MFS transporter [Sporosarcina sp. ANT_H38]KAA0955522.1 MFS transporter [Sporosarcina sp. ANT_H38]